MLARTVAVVGSLLVALTMLAAAAPEASAHAALLRTTPADGEVVQRSPAEVTLTFGEAVGTGLGALRVLSSDGDRVDTGKVSTSDGGRTVHVPLRPDLARGTYLVAWRVVSADSHPVSGTFTFSLGAPTKVEGYVGRMKAPRSPGFLLGTTRFVGFAALLALLGGAIFCLVLWPAGLSRRSTHRLLAGAAAVEAVASAGALLLQGPYAAGLSATRLFDGGLISSVLDTQYGRATAARIGLSLLVLASLPLLRRAPGRPAAGWLAAAGAGAAATYSLAGHAGIGDYQPYAYVADVLHLTAVAAWIGGLVMLVVALRARWTNAQADLVLPRWSRFAATTVVVLVATGAFATYREARSFGALTGTTYGVILLVKIMLVAVMLALALAGRAFLRERYASPGRSGGVAEPRDPDALADLPRLRRPVAVESSVAVAVVALTAVLVQTPPARSSYAPPYTGTSAAGPYTVQVDLYPARKGVNGLHVYTVGHHGRTENVKQVSGVLTRRGTEPIDVHPVHKSLGHYEDLHVVIPDTGTWRLTLQIRVSALDSYPTTQTITIR